MTSERAQPESVERLSWLVLVLALAASVWLVRRAPARPSLASSPPRLELTDNVPEGPALLVTLDVAALGPALARELLPSGAKSLLGLSELCGFEPLLALRRLALAMPPRAEGAPDFALLADTTLTREQVLHCAEAVIQKRGGSPARTQLGAFESVRDRKKPLGEIAVRGDGLLVLSGGEYFRAVLDAASGGRGGDEAARLRSAIHARVRGNLGRSAFVLSALPGAPVSLPGVQALGVGLSLERDVRLRGRLYCATAAACQEAQELLREVLREAAKEPSLAGLAELELALRGAELEVNGRLPFEQLGPLFSQLLAP